MYSLFGENIYSKEKGRTITLKEAVQELNELTALRNCIEKSIYEESIGQINEDYQKEKERVMKQVGTRSV